MTVESSLRGFSIDEAVNEAINDGRGHLLGPAPRLFHRTRS
ncbi:MULTISPECIES: hypothetical protein [Frankia]|nr:MULTISPECIES: hypothetical protein [Frankia]